MLTAPPNFLVLMSDQHRYDYLGAAGAGFLQTPQLDGLAQLGMHFTQCITNAPLCGPARFSLATGLLPHRAPGFPAPPQRQTTYYQRLRGAGYRVGVVGKLDLFATDGRSGNPPEASHWGFTDAEIYKGKRQSSLADEPTDPYTHRLADAGLFRVFLDDYTARRKRSWFLDARDSVLPAADHAETNIARRAAEWVSQAPGGQPWHLFVSFLGPHDPFDPPREFGERYRRAEMPLPVENKKTSESPLIQERQRSFDIPPEALAVSRRQYCALISFIDAQIGTILSALDARGMRENTWIFYISDHGEMLGDHGLIAKKAPYEAALRVPLLAVPPAAQHRHFRTGSSGALVEIADIGPTLCELAGLPPWRAVDGRSFAPLLPLDSAEGTHREAAVSVLDHFQCIRSARHKLVVNLPGAPELYDLEADPQELHNIAPAQPRLVDEMVRCLEQRLLNPPGGLKS